MDNPLNILEENKVFVKDLEMEMVSLSLAKEVLKQLHQYYVDSELNKITNNILETNKQIREELSKAVRDLND